MHLASLQSAVDVAVKAIPDMTPASSRSLVRFSPARTTTRSFCEGIRPLTSRLFKPALIDAETGILTDSRDMPWYVTTLLISQPLHFGDYGGMPLKIIWAILDILTISSW